MYRRLTDFMTLEKSKLKVVAEHWYPHSALACAYCGTRSEHLFTVVDPLTGYENMCESCKVSRLED